ncbi:cupin domain-containing protein [Gracilibacillus salinarum]|uniref:Cupin domain-containing protein n=1 Tax=Gracilibacillus salinarum TaxID=2932255 RepID=A0ABY4GJH8_9BACI|nr:cupin domain-containing protein [Gracilibacillus salinarum]UOQ84349.1 cupin domain-containing protein [Gracilibacillus salinarum]
MHDQQKALQFTFDVNDSPFFVQDNQNYINIVGQKQMNTLKNLSLLDIFLSNQHIVEPHYHQNASELVYCISGSALVAILNPDTKQLMQFQITPGQVANVPQGWWHYEIALTDHTHLLAIFDAPNPEVILGSDLLRLTPPEVMAYTYGLNQQLWQQAVAPIQSSTYIGPVQHRY